MYIKGLSEVRDQTEVHRKLILELIQLMRKQQEMINSLNERIV